VVPFTDNGTQTAALAPLPGENGVASMRTSLQVSHANNIFQFVFHFISKHMNKPSGLESKQSKIQSLLAYPLTTEQNEVKSVNNLQRIALCMACCLAFGLPVPLTVAAPVSVRDFGAVGDGNSDDSKAFQKAFEAAEGDVLIPPGRYKVANVEIPDGTTAHGVGAKSVIVVPRSTGCAFRVGSDCTVMDLKFTSESGPAKGLGTPPGTVHGESTPPYWTKRLTLIRLLFENVKGCAISLNHVRGFTISDCHFLNIGTAIALDFSHNGLVSGNQINNAANHGIMFWGSWKYDPLERVSDVIFANNCLNRGGRGAIWGMGGRQIVMAGNVIDGAEAFGLDLEWCEDSTIVGNMVTNCSNAGIALFAACSNVTISGNSVVIGNSPDGQHAGIWLARRTPRYVFDEGHRLVAITGNSIRVEGDQPRRGIFIGDTSSNIVYQGNVMQNANIVDRSGKPTETQASDEPTATMTVLKLSQKWQFKPDPDDQGIQDQWFASQFDDSSWSVLRSDQKTGWESQAFEGYVGYGWYRAELPKLPQRSPDFKYLYFGGVDEQAWVYINGQLVGEHTVETTGQSIEILWNEPFSIDVTKHLRIDGPNIVAVRVHNLASMGGIWKPVYLILSDTTASLLHQQEAIRLSAWEPLSLQNRW